MYVQHPHLWFRVAGGDFNWYQIRDIWRVKPTALGPDVTPWSEPTAEQLAALCQPSLNKRLQNTIGTKERFVDFTMSFQFRCPNARDVFTVVHDDNEKIAYTRGAQNWGNSSVKIFGPHFGTGVKVNILDSYLDDKSILPTTNLHASSYLNDCSAACSGYVPVGQLCGSVCMKHSPAADATKPAEGWPVPTGDWSTMQLFFSSRRTKADGTLVKNAHLRIVLNDVETFAGELDYSATTNRTHLKDGFWAESGSIYLQEHDNMVEFKNIDISPL